MYCFQGRTVPPFGPSAAQGRNKPTSRCQTVSSIRTLGNDKPVIPGVPLQLLVYIGALAIMFLFVVMLLDIPATEIIAHQRGTYPVAGLLFLALVFAITSVLWQPGDTSPFVTPFLSTEMCLEKNLYVETPWQTAAVSHPALAQLGVALYGVHVDLLLMASLLLLVAMMGAVALTLKRRVHAPLHDVFVQHSVDFQKIVSKVQESWIFIF